MVNNSCPTSVMLYYAFSVPSPTWRPVITDSLSMRKTYKYDVTKIYILLEVQLATLALF